MTRVLLTGASGAGKSTIAKLLKSQGFAVFDIDDSLCAWRNRETLEAGVKPEGGCSAAFLAAHDWVCDETKLQKLLSDHTGTAVLVVGVSSNQHVILPYFDRVLLLRCETDTLLERLATRTGNSFGKSTDERQAVIAYHKGFEAEMIGAGAYPLSNDADPGAVMAAIANVLSGTHAPAP